MQQFKCFVILSERKKHMIKDRERMPSGDWVGIARRLLEKPPHEGTRDLLLHFMRLHSERFADTQSTVQHQNVLLHEQILANPTNQVLAEYCYARAASLSKGADTYAADGVDPTILEWSDNDSVKWRILGNYFTALQD